jgi:transcriptional regulator CtsR
MTVTNTVAEQTKIYNYGMFNEAGNAAVTNAVESKIGAAQTIRFAKVIENEDKRFEMLYDINREIQQSVVDQGFREVTDTAVREMLALILEGRMKRSTLRVMYMTEVG